MAMTDRTGRSELRCLKCDDVDPMKTRVAKWANSRWLLINGSLVFCRHLNDLRLRSKWGPAVGCGGWNDRAAGPRWRSATINQFRIQNLFPLRKVAAHATAADAVQLVEKVVAVAEGLP